MLLNYSYFCFGSKTCYLNHILYTNIWKINISFWIWKSRLSLLPSKNEMVNSKQVKGLQTQEPLEANSNNHKSRWYCSVVISSKSLHVVIHLVNNSYISHTSAVCRNVSCTWHLNDVSHNEVHRHETERLTLTVPTWVMRKV